MNRSELVEKAIENLKKAAETLEGSEPDKISVAEQYSLIAQAYVEAGSLLPS